MNKRHKILCLFVILLFNFQSFSNSRIDSIRILNPDFTIDTTVFENYSTLWQESLNNNLDSAIYYALLSCEIAESLDDFKRIGKANIMAGIAFIYKSNSEKAYQHFVTALENYKILNDPILIADALNNIGIYYTELGLLNKALLYYLEALEYRKASTDIVKTALVINNIGIIYYDLKEYDFAMKYYQDALTLFEKINDSEGIGIATNNIADVYMKTEHLDEALSYYRRSYEQEKFRNSSYGIAYELTMIGRVYYRMKNYQTAIDTLNHALDIMHKVNSELGICETNMTLAKVYFDQNNLKDAERCCLDVFVIATKIKSDEWRKESSEYLAMIYEIQEMFKNALYYHKIFKSSSDKIVENQNIKEITKLTMDYEFNKESIEKDLLHQSEIKEQKILRTLYVMILVFVIILILFINNRFYVKRKANIQLLAKNEQITIQKDQLKALNAAKDKFFSIIAHDLKSPFNSILGFTQVLDESYDNYTDQERKKMIGILTKTSKHSFLLLQNLLTWARSQKGTIEISKERLPLKQLVDESIGSYMGAASLKKLEVCIDVSEKQYIAADHETMRTVIGNIVNNSIKYTNQGGKIIISAKTISSDVVLTISDNGVGMSSKTIVNLFKIEESFSIPGTADERGTGLGLIICKEFVEKNGGKIWAQSEEGVGTTFKISLPIA